MILTVIPLQLAKNCITFFGLLYNLENGMQVLYFLEYNPSKCLHEKKRKKRILISDQMNISYLNATINCSC